jgi:hypothetical protein
MLNLYLFLLVRIDMRIFAAKMYRILQYIILSITIISYFIATSGISVYYHHCNETGFSQIAYSSEEIHCENLETNDICGEKNCCQHQTKEENQHHCNTEKHHKEKHFPNKDSENNSFSSTDCCSTNTLQLKIENLTQTNKQVLSFKELTQAIILLKIINPVLIEEADYTVFKDISPPPMLFGKFLVIFFSQFKISL